MQLTMLKESFFFLPSYKYGHLKRTFFSGANVEEDVEDVAFPVFGFAKTTAVVVWHILFWSYNSRKLFQASAPLKQKYALDANEYPSPPPDKSKCEAEKKKDKFHWIDWQVYHKKNNFCLLFAKSRAPRQICLRGQVFVRLETSRSHLAWSTDSRNLTDFLVIITNLSKFCPKCDLGLILKPNEMLGEHWKSLFEQSGTIRF